MRNLVQEDYDAFEARAAAYLAKQRALQFDGLYMRDRAEWQRLKNIRTARYRRRMRRINGHA